MKLEQAMHPSIHQSGSPRLASACPSLAWHGYTCEQEYERLQYFSLQAGEEKSLTNLARS